MTACNDPGRRLAKLQEEAAKLVVRAEAQEATMEGFNKQFHSIPSPLAVDGYEVIIGLGCAAASARAAKLFLDYAVEGDSEHGFTAVPFPKAMSALQMGTAADSLYCRTTALMEGLTGMRGRYGPRMGPNMASTVSDAIENVNGAVYALIKASETLDDILGEAYVHHEFRLGGEGQ